MFHFPLQGGQRGMTRSKGGSGNRYNDSTLDASHLLKFLLDRNHTRIE